MSGPEPIVQTAPPPASPAVQHQPHQHPPDAGLVPTYPSLAHPPAPAGPSQPPPPHFIPHHQPQQQQQQQWYPQQAMYPQFHGHPQGHGPHHHHPHGPGRHQPNGGGFPVDQFHPGYQGFHYQQQQQMYPHPIPGPGPATMQNGFYYQMPYGGQPYPPYPDGSEEPKFGRPGEDGGFHPNGPMHPGYPQLQGFYPPGHPYTYGGGTGYPQFPQGGVGGYGNRIGGGYRPEGVYAPDQRHHQPPPPPPPQPQPSKGLNPAAQGFNYAPSSRKLSAVNGTPNGHTPQPDIIAPAPEKLPAAGSLGLSLDPPLEPAPEPVPEPAAVEPQEPTAPSPKEEVHAQEPTGAEVTEGPGKESATEPAAEQLPSVPANVPESVDEVAEPSTPPLTFTGATLSNVASPTTPTAPRARASDPIRIRPSRPAPDAEGNSYAIHLARAIPEGSAIEHLPGRRRRRSTVGHETPRGKAVYAIGTAGGRQAAPLTITFGSITEPPMPTAPEPAPQEVPVVVAAVPAPVKAKPVSWASLLHSKKKPTDTPDSLSVAPSSTLPSPSKSTVSLPSDAAGPSREAPTTPRSSATPSLPPSASSAAPQPRPVFNYAAAAAAGTALSPAEDLARLVTDGLRVGAVRRAAPVVPRGLINTGNMCFANTILQVLVYCVPFTELFEELGKRMKADLGRRTPLLEAMIIFLREFVPGAAQSSNGTSTPKSGTGAEAFVPENVYDAMKENKRFDSMRRGYQEDAEEYLGFFLNTLHEELLSIYSRIQPARTTSKRPVANGDARTIERPVSPGAGANGADDWLEVGKKQKTHVVRTAETKESAVSHIFGGTLRSVLHTPGQKDSVTLEPYQPLQLDIQAPNVSSLVDALRHLNEPEVIPGVWSSAKNMAVDATKQVFIESLPQVLILHLKRFVYDPQEQNVVKRAKPIAYGTELAIPNEIVTPAKRTPQGVKYKLFGVVYHHGYSATGGHYTIAGARPDGTGWIHFDDEIVQPVAVADVVVSDDEAKEGRAGNIGGREKTAYLLFYQRVK